jgi:hypothetical protein
LEKLEGQLGIPLPAATQWQVVEEAAELVIDCGQASVTFRNGRQTAFPVCRIGRRFWPAAQAAEDVPGGPVCPRFHESPEDSGDAEKDHAGVRRPARKAIMEILIQV